MENLEKLAKIKAIIKVAKVLQFIIVLLTQTN